MTPKLIKRASAVVILILVGCHSDSSTLHSICSQLEALRKCSDPQTLVEGPFVERYGKLFSVHNNTVVTGLVIEYQDDSFVKSITNYKNGQKNGKYESFHNNGQLWYEYEFVDGLEHGNSRMFDIFGNLIVRESYEAGKLNGYRLTYYPNGILKARSTYQNGAQIGVEKVFYSNQQLAIATPYENGVKHGIQMDFWSSGELRSKREYMQGKLVKNNCDLNNSSLCSVWDEMMIWEVN